LHAIVIGDRSKGLFVLALIEMAGWKVAAAGFAFAVFVGAARQTSGEELLFWPYQCRTAIAGVEFQAPPPQLRVSQPGVRYGLALGPPDLVVDAQSGAVHWPAPVEGRHIIRIRASAGSQSDKVEWILRVVPKVADDLVIHSTRYFDFVVTKRQLKPDVFLHRTDYLDGIWECYTRLIGNEPVQDRQVFRFSPGISGALAGNPIQFGGTGDYRELEWYESTWQRYGVDHELAHNFNAQIRTPGTWSAKKFSEGYGKPWLDQYLHHLCAHDIFVLQQTVIQEPERFNLNDAELRSYKDFVANNAYYRMAADGAKKFRKATRSGKTMQEAAADGGSVWGHLMNTLVQREGKGILIGTFRAMRHDGFSGEIFQGAETPEQKLTLLIALLSASAKRDLEPFFAEWGIVVEKDYYAKILPQCQSEMAGLLPEDEWVEGWVKSPVNGHYYRVLTWRTDRRQAERTAQHWGGRLLEVHSEAEQAWLARRYGHLGPIWLGLYDETGNGDWSWLSGKRLSGSYWNPVSSKDPPSRYAILGRGDPKGTWRRRSGTAKCVVIVERTSQPEPAMKNQAEQTALE
jgi:hypothetical protein